MDILEEIINDPEEDIHSKFAITLDLFMTFDHEIRLLCMYVFYPLIEIFTQKTYISGLSKLATIFAEGNLDGQNCDEYEQVCNIIIEQFITFRINLTFYRTNTLTSP